jgi:hypothetical protein
MTTSAAEEEAIRKTGTQEKTRLENNLKKFPSSCFPD